jgi:hypothetical protein
MANFANLLTTLFIGLKLTNHIDWSWVWVVSPLIFTITLSALIGGIVSVLESKDK